MMMQYKLSRRRLKKVNKMCRPSSATGDVGDNTSTMDTSKLSMPISTMRDCSTFAPIDNPTQQESDTVYPTVVSPVPVLAEDPDDYYHDNSSSNKKPPATPKKERKYPRKISRSSSVSSQDDSVVISNINDRLDSVAPLPGGAPSILEHVEQEAAAVVLLGMRNMSSSQRWVELDHLHGQSNSSSNGSNKADKTIFSLSTSPRKINEDSDEDSDMMDLVQTSSEEASAVIHRPKPSKKKRKMDSEVSIIQSSKKKRERKQLYKTIVKDSIMSSPSTSSESTTTTAATTPIKNNMNGSISGLRLAVPQDPQYLNTLHCFVRAELLEVFCIPDAKSPSSPAATATIHKPPQRVGLQCIHCAQQQNYYSTKVSGRGTSSTMSTFAPKSLADIYRGVCTWQRLHFKSCPFVPQQVQDMYWKLKDADRTRGRKAHWIDSAKELGLIDSAECHRGGIFWKPTSSASLDPQGGEDEDEDEGEGGEVHFI
jgi:hypothetical protein